MRIAQKNDNSFSCCSGFPGKILISFRGRGAGGKTRRVRLSLAPFFLPVSCPLLCPRRKNRVTFFLRMLPFFGGKVLSNFFPREKEAVAFFTTGSRKVKYRHETERKNKVFRGAQHLLAPKNFIFFLQWYFTFRGSVVIKAAHRRTFSISASALPSFGRLPHSRREIFRF